MLSEKEIKSLKAGAYGVTKNGNTVRVINILDNNVALVAVHELTWRFANYANFPYYQSFEEESGLDIVGLWEDRVEPFNLERALAGEPVLLKNKKKAYLLSNLSETNKTDLSALFDLYGLIGVVEDDPYYMFKWSLSGRDVIHSDESYSIIGMWKEPEPISSEDDLPKPIREFRDLEKVWYVQKYENQYKPYSSNKKGHWVDQQKQSLNNGCYYATEEDCQKVCDWLMNR